jgi:pectin methylesterase-like acyl-CoA thioesterase
MNSSKMRLPLLAAVVLVVPSALITLAVLPSDAATTPVTSGVYTLVSGASGKCVDVTGASTASSALLIQTSCNAAATNHQWQANELNSGQFQLVNGNSAKCVDVPSSSTASGTQLQQYSCGDATKKNQLWTFTASTAAAGKYLVKNVASGLCLSNKDASTAGNNPIVEETCSDISRIQWSFNYVSGPTTAPTATPTTSPTSGTKPTVAKDGTGSYTTVQAAVDAVPADNTSRRIITIKAGTYRESVVIPTTKPFITFQGLGSGPSNTVIVNNKPASTAGTTGSATVYVQAKEFQATNLTFNNDYDENIAASQALALGLYGDKAVLKNVRILADQDTLRSANSSRVYIANSYIEGTVDFIYGDGSMVFNACNIYEKRTTGGPITAANTAAANPYGFLFYKSTITGATNNTTQLGRPWRQDAQVLFRESSLSATIATAQPWIDMGDATWQNARFYEYKNTGAGATVNSNRPQLTDAQAANYTPQKYLAGSDGWNPIG